jgi:hypothetical protein
MLLYVGACVARESVWQLCRVCRKDPNAFSIESIHQKDGNGTSWFRVTVVEFYVFMRTSSASLGNAEERLETI